MHTRQTVFEFEPKKGSFVMDTYSTSLRAFRGPLQLRPASGPARAVELAHLHELPVFAPWTGLVYVWKKCHNLETVLL